MFSQIDFNHKRYDCKYVFVFGCGSAGKNTKKKLEKNNIKVSYFVDNSLDKIGTKIGRVSVLSVKELLEIIDNENDYIIQIASSYDSEISQQLLECGIDQKKIIHYGEFEETSTYRQDSPRWRQLSHFLLRNAHGLSGESSQRNCVNLEWVDNNNLGDELAPVIYNWMLEQKQLQPNHSIKKTVHLMTVGSILGARNHNFDSVVWGSGCHLFSNIGKLFYQKAFQKFDIRAVRGPITGNILKSCGHFCPNIYGDPAVLMPLIYHPKVSNEKKRISIVFHYRSDGEWIKKLHDAKNEYNDYYSIHFLNIATNDYKSYINEMLKSQIVISSSLHGIILAEAYGIPAVFLNTGDYVEKALMKYYDWYYSTNRYNVKIARSLEEAIEMEPMPLPYLDDMRHKLIDSFPYDLYGSASK